MKIIAKKQLIAMALMGTMSQVAMANTANCEENYGPWCDLANFLEQQEATAAGGPINSVQIDLNGTSFNSDEFNGQLEDGSGYESYVLFFKEYNSKGTKAQKQIKHKLEYNTAVLGKVTVNVDDNNNISTFTLNLDDGTVIDLSSDFAGKDFSSLKNKTINTSLGKIKKLNTNMQVPSEDNLIGNFNGKFVDGTYKKYRSNGAFGNLTSKVDIANLNNINASFDYKINAYSVRSFGNAKNDTATMNVNFGNSSWTMNGFYDTNITNGTITGNTFDSNNSFKYIGKNKNITEIDSSSYVRGSFLGENASNVAGIAEITEVHKNTNKNKSYKAVFNGSQIVQGVK